MCNKIDPSVIDAMYSSYPRITTLFFRNGAILSFSSDEEIPENINWGNVVSVERSYHVPDEKFN